MEKKQAPSLGPYQLLEHRGKDAFGSLYIAKNANDKPIILRIVDTLLTQEEGFEERFALLKSVFLGLKSQHLLALDDMFKDRQLYFIAKELPSQDYQSLDTLCKEQREKLFQEENLKEIFLSIAEGLLELESLQKSYFQEGIIYDCLSAKNILLTGNKALLDAYMDSFLFFSEGPFATLLQQSAEARFFWMQKKTGFEEQGLYPPDLRQGKVLPKEFAIASFGALLYLSLSKSYPRGIFEPLCSIHPQLHPLWDEIVDKSLARVYKSAKELIVDLKKIPQKKNSLQKAIQETPKGMALISFETSVELGAMDGPKNEQGRFRAKIQAFFMDLHPVSCQEFSRFMSSYQRSPLSDGDQQPATRVSLQMAKAYCRWRSLQEGLEEDSYRLPSEYEWEAAARGENGELYPWGQHFDPQRLHCDKQSGCKTLLLKSFEPQRFGLYQMLGNVWEWTSSIYASHPFAKDKFANQGLYTVKGGACTSPAKLCRASLRKGFPPGYQSDYLSFRCARSLKPGSQVLKT